MSWQVYLRQISSLLIVYKNVLWHIQIDLDAQRSTSAQCIHNEYIKNSTLQISESTRSFHKTTKISEGRVRAKLD